MIWNDVSVLKFYWMCIKDAARGTVEKANAWAWGNGHIKKKLTWIVGRIVSSPLDGSRAYSCQTRTFLTIACPLDKKNDVRVGFVLRRYLDT